MTNVMHQVWFSGLPAAIARQLSSIQAAGQAILFQLGPNHQGRSRAKALTVQSRPMDGAKRTGERELWLDQEIGGRR